MQNTEKQRDSRKTRSSDDERGPRQTIVRFFTRTHASLMLAAVACALPAQSQQAIVTFDPPDSISMTVNGISTSGMITGGYTDIYTNNHGFLRTPDGQFTIFEAPAGNNIQPQGIAVTSAGVITGGYWRWAGWDPVFGNFYIASGFLRHADGTIVNIDPPTAIESYPGAINNQGTIVGSYFSSVDFSDHFCVRTAGGAFTTFDPEPGAFPWSTVSILAG